MAEGPRPDSFIANSSLLQQVFPTTRPNHQSYPYPQTRQTNDDNLSDYPQSFLSPVSKHKAFSSASLNQ